MLQSVYEDLGRGRIPIGKGGNYETYKYILLLAAVIIMCCGCAGTSENEENVKGMSEYQKAQLDVAEVYGFGKTHDGYVCIGEILTGML